MNDFAKFNDDFVFLETDVCWSNPCYNGGICEPQNHGVTNFRRWRTFTPQRKMGFRCICRGYYGGALCQSKTYYG